MAAENGAQPSETMRAFARALARLDARRWFEEQMKHQRDDEPDA